MSEEFGIRVYLSGTLKVVGSEHVPHGSEQHKVGIGLLNPDREAQRRTISPDISPLRTLVTPIFSQKQSLDLYSLKSAPIHKFHDKLRR